MYQPPHFREERRDVLIELIRRHPLAAIVALSGDGFEINHVPCLIDPADGPAGILRLHVARANPLVDLARSGAHAAAIFQGPQTYITPSWYASKREHGKVVPTWNYAVVHAHGVLSLHDDGAWLADQTRELTDTHEGGRAQAWSVDDAPPEFMRGQMKGIVGIVLTIARLEGKWKVSQNRVAADRSGVVAGLGAESDGAAMAALVAGEPKT